jgi:hypothetical protein
MADLNTTGYCYYCAGTFPIAQFTASKLETRSGALKGRCKTCTSHANRAYRQRHPEKLRAFEQKRRADPERKEFDRQRSYKRKYGISQDDYNARRAAQGPQCYLCGMSEETSQVSRWGVLCLDHCHATGVIRKFLCARCNKGLGCFGDDPELLARAAEYIRSFRTVEKVKGVA